MNHNHCTCFGNVKYGGWAWKMKTSWGYCGNEGGGLVAMAVKEIVMVMVMVMVMVTVMVMLIAAPNCISLQLQDFSDVPSDLLFNCTPPRLVLLLHFICTISHLHHHHQ